MLGSLPSALLESPGSADKDDDLDMLIIDVSTAAQHAKALAWADAVVGHLCAIEDARDSILMVLLMPEVCRFIRPQCWLHRLACAARSHSRMAACGFPLHCLSPCLHHCTKRA